jgi:hypothetical protein
MSLHNLEYSTCTHIFFPSKTILHYPKELQEREPKIYFCKECGVLKIDSVKLFYINLNLR